jgi:hypothetical protein
MEACDSARLHCGHLAMWVRSLLLAGLFLLSGCGADDQGYYAGSSYGGTTTYYYAPTDYSTPYQPSSPVYGAPYANGPVMGGIYTYGDAGDLYGGPVFIPYQGIRCDRRRQACWGPQGLDPRWSGRFFGHRYSNWDNGHWGNGGWNGYWPNNPNWPHDGDNHQGHGNPGGGQGHGNQNPGHHNPGNNQPWVYQVPKNPDGSGTPAFQPNGCGENGLPPCN